MSWPDDFNFKMCAIDVSSFCFISPWHFVLFCFFPERGETVGSVVAGSGNWKAKSRKAFGLSISLYERHPFSKRKAGKCFAFPVLCVKFFQIILKVRPVLWKWPTSVRSSSFALIFLTNARYGSVDVPASQPCQMHFHFLRGRRTQASSFVHSDPLDVCMPISAVFYQIWRSTRSFPDKCWLSCIKTWVLR